VRAADRSHTRFRKAEVLDLTLANQILHRSRDVFDWDVGVDTVLIEQIDGIDLEPLERGLGDFLDVCRPAAEAAPSIGFERESELRRDYHVIAIRREAFAHELFIDERPVRFSSVEERDPAFDGCVEQ
jgi:hypothetical protein